MRNSFVTFISLIAALSFATCIACSASTPGGSKTSGDWSGALKDGRCTRDAGDDAYTTCLEKQVEISKRRPPPESTSGYPEKLPPPRPDATAGQPPIPGAVLIQRTETTTVQQPAQPPPIPPPTVEEKPVQTTLPSGTVIWVPVAAGPYCSLPNDQKVLELTINNDSPYLLEVRGKVVPLNCQQGDKFIQARVQRKNGKQEATWVIPGGMQRAKLVFLPFNGGLGEVSVHIDAFLNMGTTAPALAVGFLDHTFEKVGTKMYKWDVSTSLIRGYK